MATGQRVVKHRHVADEALGIDAAGVRGARRVVPAGCADAGRAEAAHRALASVPIARRRRRSVGSPRGARVHGATAAPARPEGIAMGAAARARTRGAGRRTARGRAGRACTIHDRARSRARAPARARGSALARGARSRDRRGRAFGRGHRSERDHAEARTGTARAQPAWAARPYDERAAALRAFRDLLGDRSRGVRGPHDERDGQADQAGAQRDQRGARPRRLEHRARGRGDRAARRLDRCGRRAHHLEPVGVVAHISAWNYPYFVGLNTDRARAARPATRCCTSRRSTRRSPGCGSSTSCTVPAFPSTSVQAVVGAGATGAALVAADVDMVCFTGSYATGQLVCGPRPTAWSRVQLELGGKDAAYVCDDVDVEGAALAVAEGAFYNSGQSCSATERVYVHDVDLGRLRRRVRRGRRRATASVDPDRRDDRHRARWRARRNSTCSTRSLPTRCSGARRSSCGGSPHRSAGQLVRADRRGRRRRSHGAHARGVIRAGHRS